MEWWLDFAWYPGETRFGSGVEDFDPTAGVEFFPDIMGEWRGSYACEAVLCGIFVFNEELVVLGCFVDLDGEYQSGGSFFAEDAESLFTQDGIWYGIERPDDRDDCYHAEGTAQKVLQLGAFGACS